jgi:hypothetical protein
MVKAATTGEYIGTEQNDVIVRIEPEALEQFAQVYYGTCPSPPLCGSNFNALHTHQRYDDCYSRYDQLLRGQDVHRY